MSRDDDDITAAIEDLELAIRRLDDVLLRRHLLQPNDRLALIHIARGTFAPSELSTRIGVTTAGMTRMLDRLERDRFVDRERHQTDARRVIVSLTKKGFAAALEFEQVRRDIASRADELGTHWKAGFHQLLRDVRADTERRLEDA